jgi:hypothetical protein
MIVYLATPHSYKDVFNTHTHNEVIHGISKRRGGYVFKGASKYELMDIYLAGINAGNVPKDVKMNLYLAGHSAEKNRTNSDSELYAQKIYVLESFYYIQDWMLPYIKNDWNFLLDSGAFTFMNDKKNAKNINWDEYTEKYAKFINENNIELFFELDIDSIVGIKEVERIRNKLENLTQKKSIPVWHKSRGFDYWIDMCKSYDYIAIGGIVTQEIKRTEYSIFSNLLKIAKQNNCKVHGLGFTNLDGIKKYKFYSVDSTTWIMGNRSGFIYRFTGDTLIKIDKPIGTRLKGKEVAIHNFKEWVKFQRYAEHNL